jgi:hypothetical protein
MSINKYILARAKNKFFKSFAILKRKNLIHSSQTAILSFSDLSFSAVILSFFIPLTLFSHVCRFKSD